jgi:glycosyltransferase involved in cell wall biosynthesis
MPRLTPPDTGAVRHLVHVFPTFTVGGVQHRIIRVAKALRGKYRHTVISLDGNFDAAAGLGGDPIFAFETLPVVKSRLVSLRNLARARAALRRLQPDLLLTYNWGAVEWALANHLPRMARHLHLESGFGPDESPEHQHWRRARARRLLLVGCERIIVPSLVLRDIVTRVWQFPPDRVRYVPNGIDYGRFARGRNAASTAALGIPQDAPVIGTVAALRREKNLLRLVRVFAALPRALDARLVIVGDGPERAALVQAAADCAVSARVIFTGAMADPERILGCFDVFALTSDTEQMPNSVLEAMAAGCPVAATDVGDVRQMVAPENAGFVVPVEDEAALAERIAALLRDPAARVRLGRANQDRVRREYALEQMVARYDAVFSGTEAAAGGSP